MVTTFRLKSRGKHNWLKRYNGGQWKNTCLDDASLVDCEIARLSANLRDILSRVVRDRDNRSLSLSV